MIHEFALDPALVALWSDRREFQRYGGKFGIGTPRIMCRVPHRHWRRLVREAFEVLVAGLDAAKIQARRKNLESLLVASLDGGTSRRSCECTAAWFELAAREHRRRAFQALLVDAATAAQEAELPILRDAEFNEEGPPWRPPHDVVRREPDALADALAPLLSFARVVRVVEPHFDPSKAKWRNTVALLVERAVRRREPLEWPTVEIHTCVSRGRGMRPVEGQTRAEQEAKAEEVLSALNRLMPQLPAGLEVAVFCWAERVGAPEFHDRFLLTDFGGLHLGKGLDADEEARGTDETITLLPREMYWTHLKRYSPASREFDLRGKRTIRRSSRDVR